MPPNKKTQTVRRVYRGVATSGLNWQASRMISVTRYTQRFVTVHSTLRHTVHEDTCQVPPLPGPSHGKRNPRHDCQPPIGWNERKNPVPVNRIPVYATVPLTDAPNKKRLPQKSDDRSERDPSIPKLVRLTSKGQQRVVVDVHPEGK